MSMLTPRPAPDAEPVGCDRLKLEADVGTAALRVPRPHRGRRAGRTICATIDNPRPDPGIERVTSLR